MNDDHLAEWASYDLCREAIYLLRQVAYQRSSSTVLNIFLNLLDTLFWTCILSRKWKHTGCISNMLFRWLINSLNNYVQRDADTWCLCKNLSNSVSLDQAIVFGISAIIMFSRSESYKLFPLLSITSVYNIWNNIFSFSLYLRWGTTFHAGVIGDDTWRSSGRGTVMSSCWPCW